MKWYIWDLKFGFRVVLWKNGFKASQAWLFKVLPWVCQKNDEKEENPIFRKPISLWNLRNPSFRYTIRHYLWLLKRWWYLSTYDIMRYFKGRRPQFFYRAEIGYFKEYYTIMCVLWFDPFLIVCYFFTVWCSASINIWRGGKFISSSKMKIRFESWFFFCAEKYKDITSIRICQVQMVLWYYFEDVPIMLITDYLCVLFSY